MSKVDYATLKKGGFMRQKQKNKSHRNFPKTDCHSDCGSDPDNSRGGQAVHIQSLFENYACSKKTDSAYNIRRDSGGIAVFTRKLVGKDRE